MKKELLSENVKTFMDYAIDTIKAMDGAPEHNEEEKANIITRIAQLKEYLDDMEQSYLENAPADHSSPVDPEYIAEAGHS